MADTYLEIQPLDAEASRAYHSMQQEDQVVQQEDQVVQQEDQALKVAAGLH